MEFLDEKTYVDQAEQVIKKLADQSKDRNGNAHMLSTSKIRGILSMAADIYDSVQQNNTSELGLEYVSRIEYLRVRMVYEIGRDTTYKVKDFIVSAKLLEYLKMIDGSKVNYILFYHYLEALVAFHRYYGGRDN